MSALETWRESLPSEASAILPKPLKLVVKSAPRTLKNSPVLVRGIGDAFLKQFLIDFQTDNFLDLRSGVVSEARIWDWLTNRDTQFPRPRLLPSPAFTAWHKVATAATLPKLEPLKRYFPITTPVHVLCKFYREADRGDWCGYAQGIGDWLQDLGIIADDKLIRSWDGTRLLKDAENPRSEIWIQHYSTERDGPMFERPAKEWAQHEEPVPVDCVEADLFYQKELASMSPQDREAYRNGQWDQPDPLEEPEAAGSRLTLFTRYRRANRP